MCSLPIPAMKAYNGKGGRAPLTLNLGARWRLVVNVMSLLLCHRYPLNRRLVGPRATLDVLKRAKPLVPAGIRAWVLQPVAYSTYYAVPTPQIRE
jgi:hypothetical protein